jgi:hypothetical protein
LVHPAIKNKALIEKAVLHKTTIGFRVFRRCGGRYCILGIARLAYDKGSKNPSARKLIKALTVRSTGADGLRKQLKADFSRPMLVGGVPGLPPSKLDLATSAELNKEEIRERQQTFDDRISQLENQWQWFKEHETKFVDFRNKRLAHLEVSKCEDHYGLTEIQK